ncbi:rax2 [Acrasis kona]|uniref:Rax2 n=1 Tax=Acrasis kona TaxID=1008807 RepID=A0AAW2Z457_9EUKA
MDLCVREAKKEEFDTVSELFFHGFLGVWNHNWFQSLSEPLKSIPPSREMTSLQSDRMMFYTSMMNATLLVGGKILVGTIQEDGVDVIVTAMLWTPPKLRFSIWTPVVLYKSGFINVLYRYGISGFKKVQLLYESNIESMLSQTLKNFKPIDCSYIQLLATHTKHYGHGYSSKLLTEMMRMHFKQYASPVLLDTATNQAKRVYLKLGYEELASREIAKGETDALGISLKPNATKEESEQCEARMYVMAMTKSHFDEINT